MRKPKIHIDELPPKLPAGEPVGIDTEGFGMIKGRLHRPYGKFACLQIATEKDVWVITDQRQIGKALRAVKKGQWVLHHAPFDLRHLRRWANAPKLVVQSPERLWDTMLVDQLLWSGYYPAAAGFGLDDLARRYLEIELDKDIREDFETAEGLTPELIEYSALDPWITLMCRHEQQSELDNEHPAAEGFDYLWNKVEGPMVYVNLDRKGAMFHGGQWEKIALGWKEKQFDLAESVNYNPGSVQQVKAALAAEGVYVRNVQAGTMEELIGRNGSEIAQTRLDYMHAQKRYSTYGLQWLKFIEEDGRIYSDTHQIGTETGREAWTKPNLQQVPVRDPGDIVYRKCFISPKGSSLGVLDYSQQETRILAYLSQDAALLEAVADRDTHQGIADMMGITRDEAKPVNLGLPYGLSAYGLAQEIGCSEYEADRYMSTYFDTFPDVKTYMTRQRSWGRSMEYVLSPVGRVNWLNLHSMQWERNSLNSPIQMGGGDMQKRSMVLLHQEYPGKNSPLTLSVHDEIVIELPTKVIKQGVAHLKDCMLRAAGEVCPDVPFAVDSHIGKTWAVGKMK